jgi:hypothetical protein
MGLIYFIIEEETLVKKILDRRKSQELTGNLRTYPRSLGAIQGKVAFREIQLGNRYCREGQGDDYVQGHHVARHGGQHLPQ